MLSHLAWPVDPATLHLSLDSALATRAAGLVAALVLFAWTAGWLRSANSVRAESLSAGGRAFVWASLPLMFALPFTSQDVFLYLAHASTWIDFGANPYLHPPADFSGHPYAHLASWPEDSAHYGPVALLLASAVHEVSPSPWLALTGMRLLGLVGLGTAFALALRLRRSLGEEDAGWSVAALALCPLVLWEGLGAAHNDAWVAALLLGAVTAAVHRRFALAGPLLAFSVGVKFTTILLVPAFLVWTWRSAGKERGRALAAGTLGALAVAFAGLMTFDGPAPLVAALTEAAGRATRSPVWALAQLGGPMGIPPDVFPFLGRLAAAGFAVTAAAAIRTPAQFLRACGWTYLVFLLGGAAWFQPWYVLPLLPLVAAASSPRLHRVTVTLAASSFVGLYGPLLIGYSWAPAWQWGMFLLTFGPVGVIAWSALRSPPSDGDLGIARSTSRPSGPRSSRPRRTATELLNS